MIHDPDLLERLGALPVEPFAGVVFRATRRNHDPRAFSTRGGRWARDGGSAVLYTSLEREGALAELSYHWSQLTPLPSKPAMLHRLAVDTGKTLRLIRASLSHMGIDPARFGTLFYERTRDVGEAVAFLGCDGLIVPSARWTCDNLVLFSDNLDVDRVKLVASEQVDWLTWARAQRIAAPTGGQPG